ncbi:MAG: hypothetical protein ACRC6X_02355 [Culicoidibacterales bacterium]
MKKIKRRLFLSLAIIIAGGIIQGIANNKLEALYMVKKASHDYHSLVGLNTASITLHAEGEAYVPQGRVDNMWITDWAWWPNYIEGKSTWKSSYPTGERANGQYTIGVGANTKWFAAILKAKTDYLALIF